MKRLFIFINFLIALSCNLINAQGLRFFGNEKSIAERSSLVISEKVEKPIKKLDVRFELRIDNPISPGNIFHVRDKYGKSAFSLMYRRSENHDSVYLSFAKDGERGLVEVKESLRNVRDNSINIGISLDAQGNSAKVTIGKNSYDCMNPGLLSEGFIPELYFGMNRHIVETASFMLRNLIVAKDGKSVSIPLNESEGTDVHSTDGGTVGRVDNPNWLINSSRMWDKMISFCSTTPTGIAFDEDRSRFFSYNADSLRTYDVLAKKLKEAPLTGPGKLPTRLGMNFYDAPTGKIIPYEIYYNNISAEIDPEAGTWGKLRKVEDDKVFHHHAQARSGKRGDAILFGGYGDRMYFNSVLRFDPVNLVFDTVEMTGDNIPPRFYAGMMMTTSGDSIYIYGGKGNLEGKQDLGVRYYYDFYVVDLKTGKSKKLWEQSSPATDRVPARTLIPDADGKYFYAITYAEYNPHSSLQLYKINIADGEEVAVGDTIPLISEEIATNVALFNSPSLDKIFCVVQEFEKYGETTTSIYSISTPLLPLSTVNGSQDKAESSNWNWLWLCVAIVVTCGLIYFVVMIVRNRSPRGEKHEVIKEPLNHMEDGKDDNVLEKTESEKGVDAEENVDKDDSVKEGSEKIGADRMDAEKKESEKVEAERIELEKVESAKIESDKNGNDKTQIEKRNREKNSISLFGPFEVISREGRDITYMFSPKLKMVFIYILLHSIGKNGVASSDLNAVFWSDKDVDKVKNLRNVTLNKIRKIIGDIDGIELVYEKGLFRITISEDCFCDIRKVYDLSFSLRDYHPAKENSEVINGIFLHGKFLMGMEDPVFDYFRQQIEGYMENYHTEMMSEYYNNGRYDKVRYLSKSLLMVDPLSETALKYGILACRKSGRSDIAIAMYSSFVKDYKKMMGEDYPVRYDDF